ncbi:MAG: caspase family protein [Gammaproteobacteria bacterium]|nr:caspase family protein [Gammaproteobacteria bacterium]
MRAAVLAAALAVGSAAAGEPPAEPLLRVEAGLHTAVVNQAAVTRDGQLVTVSDDKTVRIWSPGRGPTRVLRVPIGPGTEGALYAVAASPTRDVAVVAGHTGLAWDGAGAVYGLDLQTGALTGRVGGLPGTVHALATSRDGRYLAIGTGGRASLRVVDLSNRTIAAQDEAYGDTVVSAAFLPDGKLATAALDGKVRLYGADFKLASTRAMPKGRRPWRLAVSPDGERIAVGSFDAPQVAILAAQGLKPLAELTGAADRSGGLSAVAWTRSGLVAAGTYGEAGGAKRLRAWDRAGRPLGEAVIATDTVTDLVGLEDGSVAFTTAEPSVGFVDPETLRPTVWRRSFADFRDAFDGTFAASGDGTVVDFGMDQGGRFPVRFDLNDRTLVRDPPARPGLSRPSAPKSVRSWRNAARPSVGGVALRLDENETARAAAGSADGSLVLLGADYSLRLFRAGKPVWRIPLHAVAWAVNLTADGRLALAALGDGTLRWYRVADGAEVLALFAARDGRWIAWTPEGYFDHSPGAENLVGYHVNRGRAGSPDFVVSGQIHRDFYRPDLVTLKVKGEDIGRDVQKTGDARSMVAGRVPPGLRLLGWCTKGDCAEPGAARAADEPQVITVRDPRVTLRVGVEDRGGGAGRVVLKRNTAVIPTRSTAFQDEKGGRVEEHSVALEPGENLITISAYDPSQSVESGAPIRFVIRYVEAPPEAPVLHVLSVGIDRYRSADVAELVNAANDARAVGELMPRIRQGLFREAQVTVLLNEQATLAGIRQAFERVAAAAQPEDVVLLFLAGHGVISDGRYSFLPHDLPALDARGLREGALGQEALADLLASLPTSRAAVLIDTCHAGAVAGADAVLRQSRDRAWVGALGYNTGRFVLAGTTTQQEALDGIAGHGVFTAVVLDGLSGIADRKPKGNEDGRVDVVELTRYAEARVPEEATKIAPTHAQRAVGFFAGSDFFELSAPRSD